MTTRPALLDVNVLIALIDPAHQFHESAHRWFTQHRKSGWATCPITENGALRIISKTAYPALGLSPAHVRTILAELCGVGNHAFWPDSVSILDTAKIDLSETGAKSITDIYLLALANSHGGRLVTFDRKIAWQDVVGCSPDNLEVLD